MRKLVIILVAVVVALLVIDVGLRAYAESRTADGIAEELHAPVKPDVSIEGFPFLLGVVRGHYPEVVVTQIRVDMPAVAGVRAVLSLHDVDLTITDAISRDVTAMTAESADLQVRVPLSSLAAAIGRPNLSFGAGQNGTLQISATIIADGRNVPIVGTGTVTVSDQQLTIGVEQFTAVGAMPAAANEAAATLASELSVSIPLTGLPFEITGATGVVDGSDLLLTVTTGGFMFADLT